jgi:hypothetical protein
MGRKSRGRGTAALFGLLLLIAGLVGGGVLFAMSVTRPSAVVDNFARAGVGCTTTLEFTETGTFWIYEEEGPAGDVDLFDCRPTPDPSAAFGVTIEDDQGPIPVVPDGSIEYDVDDRVGRSIGRIEIGRLGEHRIAVVGNDPAVVAAIGRDPDLDVDRLRFGAYAVAGIGVVLGVLLLLLAGRRSKQAATFEVPEGPGWGPRPVGAPTWPPEPPRLGQMPINPHRPDEPVDVAPDVGAPDGAAPDTAGSDGAARDSVWAPPSSPPTDLPAPPASDAHPDGADDGPPAPPPPPSLPDVPTRHDGPARDDGPPR